MLARCGNATHHGWANYGGRGIRVDPLWDPRHLPSAEAFKNFVKHLGWRPKGTTLDRKEVNGNYAPGNVRWATNKEQANNKRKTVIPGIPIDAEEGEGEEDNETE